MPSDAYTSAGEAKVIDLMDTVTWYAAVGIGTTAAAKTDTALENVTGCPARVQTTDTQPTDDKLQMVALFAFTSALAITELGILDAASNGTLLQRHVFDPINTVNGDSIQFTVLHEQA